MRALQAGFFFFIIDSWKFRAWKILRASSSTFFFCTLDNGSEEGLTTSLHPWVCTCKRSILKYCVSERSPSSSCWPLAVKELPLHNLINLTGTMQLGTMKLKIKLNSFTPRLTWFYGWQKHMVGEAVSGSWNSKWLVKKKEAIFLLCNCDTKDIHVYCGVFQTTEQRGCFLLMRPHLVRPNFSPPQTPSALPAMWKQDWAQENVGSFSLETKGETQEKSISNLSKII
jgi:hypothetical protein